MPEVASPPSGAPPKPVVGAPPSMAPRQVASPEAPMMKPSSSPTPSKPAATPEASPKPAVESPPTPAAGGEDQDYFAELDKQFKTGEEPGKSAAKPEEAEKPAAAAPVKPEAKVKPVSAPELRAELARLHTELETRNKAHDDLQKKIVDFEKRGKDTDALKTQYEAQQKKIDSLESENRALKQETTPEFKEKYEEPFNQAASYAQAQIQQLQIQDAETGTPRMATWEDFVGLYGMPAAKAIAAAKDLFGDGAQLVMGHLQELHRLDFQKQTALQKERAAWKERKSAEETQRAIQNQEREAIQAKVHQELGEKVDGYHDSPDDKESAELRTKGYEIYGRQPKTFQEYVLKEGHIKHRVAAYGPNQLKIQRLTQELAEAKKELEGFRNPEPGKVKRAGGEASAGDSNESWEDAARKHMANA